MVFLANKNWQKDIFTALAAGLLVTMLVWSVGFHLFTIVHAANLTSVSDTLTDSRPGISTNHVITYTNATGTTAGQTITYQFDPTTNLFGNVTGTLFADVTSTSMTIVSSCSVGSNRVSFSTSTANTLTFTVCASNTVASGTITLSINNNRIVNPTSTGSYIIRVNAGTNSADTRVVITNGVAVTASIATTFTFTVAGDTTSTTLGNNATTTNAATSSSLPFGTIVPGGHAELAQLLAVTTNAANGFAVTVHEDQDMTSQTGNTIHLFKDGNATSTPSPWSAPSSIIGNRLTYGHIGVTSDDADFSNGKFGTSTPLYAGAFQSTTTLTIFSATGTADGTTQNIGKANVAYRIEIGPLQAAANDYTNNLIYVATPVY